MMTLITATNTLLAQAGGWWDHMSGWGGGWMWLWGTLMMLSWVAIIAGAAPTPLSVRPSRPRRDSVELEILNP